MDSLLNALAPGNLLLALAAVVAGTVIGALPGLSATMAMAILVPFTFAMDPSTGLIALGAIYMSAIYGGCFSAILVNTPGTPAAIATTFDGYPMARRGDGDLAVSLATLASVVGGVIGVLCLMLMAPPLAEFALAFGPVEYFWIAVFGLTLVSGISVGGTLLGLVGACVGLLLSMVGSAVIGGDVRYTFGQPDLLGGVNVVAALIGLYCVPVLIDMVATGDAHLKAAPGGRGWRLGEAAARLLRARWNVLRSSAIGVVIGILPAAGASIAGLLAYSEARRVAPEPARFGTGEPDGVIASETSNNASIGGTFIPTLVLGIPGAPADAIILGALMVQGIRTGPSLFNEQASIVWTFMWGLMLATLLMLPVGLVIGRYAYRSIIGLPKAMLAPVVAFLVVVGTYAIDNSVADPAIMVALGVAGWALNRCGIGPSPIVLGLVLGPIAEQGFVQGYLIGNANQDVPGEFFGRPLSLAIIALVVLSLAYPLLAERLRRKARPEAAAAGAARPRPWPPGIAVGLAFAALGAWAFWTARGFSAFASVFPLTISAAMVLFALAAAAVAARGMRPPADELGGRGGSVVRRIALVAAMAAWVLSLDLLGFVGAGLLGTLGVLAIANHDGWTRLRLALWPAVLVVVVVGVHRVFADVLNIPMPRASLF
jgi:putative tricarboxylic transport membrane protein